MIQPTRADLIRARNRIAAETPETASMLPMHWEAYGAAVERAQIVAWMRASGDPILQRYATRIELEEHWEDGDG